MDSIRGFDPGTAPIALQEVKRLRLPFHFRDTRKKGRLIVEDSHLLHWMNPKKRVFIHIYAP